MSSYREQSEKAKVARREPAPEKMANVPSKTRRPKPVMRWGVYRKKKADDLLSSAIFGNKPWFKCETIAQAQEWIDKQLRSLHVPKDSKWNIQQLQERERQRWQIKELT